MRFSYIDSEGKEIEVDSVESLALRIELGAIEPDTRMYDAVSDRWAPAREHPVFRSLSRGEEVLEEDVVPIGEDESGDAAQEPRDGTSRSGAPQPEPPPAEPETAEAEDVEPEDVEPEVADLESAADEAEIGPAEPETAEAASEPGDVEPGTAEAEDLEPGDVEPGGGEPEDVKPEPDEPAAEHSVSGVIHDEQPAQPPESGTPADSPRDDRPDGGSEEPSRAGAGTSDASEEDAPDEGLGLDFQLTMQEEALGSSGDVAGPAGADRDEEGEDDEDPEAGEDEDEDDGLPLIEPEPETPAGRERPPAGGETADSVEEGGPPAWASEEEALFTGERPAPDADAAPGPADEGDTAGPANGGGAGVGEAADDEMPPWARETGAPSQGEDRSGGTETPRSEGGAGGERSSPAESRRPRPSPPAHWERRKRTRALKTRLVKVVSVLLVLGAAGAAAVYFLAPGSAGGEGESSTETAVPSLPPALHAIMAEVNAAAYEDVLGELRALLEEQGLPERPPEGWLDGVYLSTAGEYPEVREYWRGVRDAAERTRSSESEIFRERLDERLGARTGEAGLSGAEVERVREAALAHYAASAPERDAVYERLLDIAQASLDLHLLLVEREADIAYEPYSSPGVSRDPVLEAIPSDSLLRAEMNQRVDRVLDLMDDAEVPRPITTAGLVEHLLAELRTVEVVREAGSP